MKSAGNDIVALASINIKRTNDYRFYSKILTVSEQALYQQPQFSGLPFEHYVWLLWSVKESAYKYLKRLNPELLFSPTKIIIQNTINADGSYTGEVLCLGDILYFQSKITAEWITSTVNDTQDFSNICWGIERIGNECYQYQSEAARALLLTQLNSNFCGDLRIEKSPVGYPIILNNNKEMNVPASLAHDGCFVGYSFNISSN